MKKPDANMQEFYYPADYPLPFLGSNLRPPTFKTILALPTGKPRRPLGGPKTRLLKQGWCTVFRPEPN